MMSLLDVGKLVAAGRGSAGLRQVDLAERARLSRATIDALENGRAHDIGFSKLTRVLAVLGLELTVRPANKGRPTLDELLLEDVDD